jgi:DNA-binding CsgD family transcriptional regulator
MRHTDNRQDIRSLGPTEKLTRREKEVLELLSQAMGTPDMAHRLGVSRTTIRNHIQRILAKLEVHNRAQAIAIALGWLR